MGLPGHRRTSSHKHRRAAHFALIPASISKDKEGNVQLPHRVNPTTGMYKGRQVVDVAKRARRALKRKQKTS